MGPERRLMATVLDKTLRREIAIKGKPFMLTISPIGLHLVPKGKRKGLDLEWEALVNGDAAMAHALNASLHSSLEPSPSTARTRKHKGNGSAGGS